MRLSRYHFGDFELDAASRELLFRGERVALPPKSFECIAYLIAHRGRAVGRDELISAVWGRVDVSDTVVAQTLLRARKALDDTGEKQAMIRTVPRFGYRWVAQVEERAPEAPAFAAQNVASMPEPTTARVDASPRGGRPYTLGVLIVLAIFLAATGLTRHDPRGQPQPLAATSANLVLVLPVDVAPSDIDTAWVRLGAMDYVASRLRQGGFGVVPSEQALHLGAQLGQHATDANWQALIATSGARWVVEPRAWRDAQGWRLSFTLHEGARSRVIEARGDTPLVAAAAATDAWLRRLGRNVRDAGPSALAERVQQIDAELFGGQLDAARALIERAPPGQRDDARLRLREGQLAFRAGRVDVAANLFDALLARKPALQGTLRAQVMMGEGAVDIRRALYDRAEARYGQALALLARDASDGPSLLGNAYNGRGVARVQQGEMDAAVQDMVMARMAMQRAGDLVEAASVGVNLGRIETQRGHYPEALQAFQDAIAVFQRFDVRDYLAAAWMAKSEAHLVLAQPDEAANAIAKAHTLASGIEDAYLVEAIEAERARAMLATGRLHDADDAIGRIVQRGGHDAAVVQELQVRLALERGATAEARRVARRQPDATAAVPGSLALAAVQAALRAHDIALARAWLARAPKNVRQDEARTSWRVAGALVAAASGDAEGALRSVGELPRVVAPDDRVRAGVLMAQVQLSTHKREAALAALGDLDAFSRSDYRVAHADWTANRALGDDRMARVAYAHVERLRGERDPKIDPVF